MWTVVKLWVPGLGKHRPFNSLVKLWHMELELDLVLSPNEQTRDLQVAVPWVLRKGHPVIAQPQEQDIARCDQSRLLIMPFPSTLTENNKPIQPVSSECVRDFHLITEAWKKSTWLYGLGFKAGLKFCPLFVGWRCLILPFDGFRIQIFPLFH